MTDDTNMRPTMSQRPQPEKPEQAGQQTAQDQENMPVQPVQRAAPGRKPLFGN